MNIETQMDHIKTKAWINKALTFRALNKDLETKAMVFNLEMVTIIVLLVRFMGMKVRKCPQVRETREIMWLS